MRRFSVLIALFVVGALLAGGSSQRAAAAYTWVVDDQGMDCTTPSAGASHMHIADALTAASAGQSIFVCDGTYAEPQLTIDKANLQLLGPGSTAAEDGMATITKTSNATGAILITADAATVAGFTIDATPPMTVVSSGIEVTAGQAIISDNVIRNAFSGQGIAVGPLLIGQTVIPDDVQILRNHLSNNGNGDIVCNCTNSLLYGNVIAETGAGRLTVMGEANTLSLNQVTGADTDVLSNNAIVEFNDFDLSMMQINVYLAGQNINYKYNTIRNGLVEEIALRIGQAENGTSVSIANNVFQSVGRAIYAADGQPDAFTTTIALSGVPTGLNNFINSGGTRDDFIHLLWIYDMPNLINAEYNNWGLCTLEDIEKEIRHGPDDSFALGTVDYDPFSEPDDCPTPSPTASPTPTGSPGSNLPGDADCNGIVDMDDFIATISEAAGVPPGVDCPDNADTDCNGSIGPADALKIILFVALPQQFPLAPCPS